MLLPWALWLVQTCLRYDYRRIFLECEDIKALSTINYMVRFLSEDNDKKTIYDKLEKIIELVGKLKLDEVERPLQISQVFTELENDWEPYIKISIDNQNFMACCDLGSMISTMPKVV